MDQIPIRAVRNVYLNNNVYICSGSQSPLPFLLREVPHPYRPREKHETEVRFCNTTILLDSVASCGAMLSGKIHGFFLYVTHLLIFSKRGRGEMSFQRGKMIIA